MKVNVGVSNRHVHLKKEDLEILFGCNYVLEVLRPVNQPGQFASTAKVTLKTDKSEIPNVRILGPVRSHTQVEISKTDAFNLGLNPPVRNSGDIENSEAITIVGPKGVLNLKEGCIIADRHIHITPQKRTELGLNDVSEVALKVGGAKGGILNNVKIRCSEQYYFEAHLDTDDANAHLIKNGDLVEIVLQK